MKILRFSAVIMFCLFSGISAGFFSSEKDVDSEIQQELAKISKNGNFIEQISELRILMAKNHKNVFNSTTQNIFGNTLQDLYNKRDKDDYHHGRILSSVLSAATVTPLLSKNQQEYVKNSMISDLKKSGVSQPKRKYLELLKILRNRAIFTSEIECLQICPGTMVLSRLKAKFRFYLPSF